MRRKSESSPKVTKNCYPQKNIVPRVTTILPVPFADKRKWHP